MGTSIHLYVEVKINGSWELYDRIQVQDYRLFGLMAGVRGDEQMFPVRGLPNDLSRMVKFEAEWWGENNRYAASHISLTEVKEVMANYAGLTEMLTEKEHYIFSDTYGWVNPAELPPLVNEVRWVFWFS